MGENPYQFSYGNLDYLSFPGGVWKHQTPSGSAYGQVGAKLTKSITTLLSHQDILQKGSNCFSRKV